MSKEMEALKHLIYNTPLDEHNIRELRAKAKAYIDKALEQKELKKPRFVEICAVNNRPEYECPNCSQGLPLYEYFECWFCPNCGQPLDLEDI